MQRKIKNIINIGLILLTILLIVFIANSAKDKLIVKPPLNGEVKPSEVENVPVDVNPPESSETSFGELSSPLDYSNDVVTPSYDDSQVVPSGQITGSSVGGEDIINSSTMPSLEEAVIVPPEYNQVIDQEDLEIENEHIITPEQAIPDDFEISNNNKLNTNYIICYIILSALLVLEIGYLLISEFNSKSIKNIIFTKKMLINYIVIVIVFSTALIVFVNNVILVTK